MNVILVRLSVRSVVSFSIWPVSYTHLEGASRQKTPNEVALTTLLVGLTIIFLLVIVTLYPLAGYSGVQIPISTMIALAVCLIPTTIGALLSAIGIAGMDRVTPVSYTHLDVYQRQMQNQPMVGEVVPGQNMVEKL